VEYEKKLDCEGEEGKSTDALLTRGARQVVFRGHPIGGVFDAS